MLLVKRNLKIMAALGLLSFVVGCTHNRQITEIRDTQARALNPTLTQCDPNHHGYKNAIVKLDTFEGQTASGVVIDRNTVLTVAHALSDNASLFARINGDFVEAKTVAVNPRLDLALLSVDTSTLEPVPLAANSPRINETMWAVGFPLAAEQRISLGQYKEMYNGRLYTSVHINSGTSGGGLLQCENGSPKLAGIVHGYVAMRMGNKRVNIGDSTSVPANVIKQFVDNHVAVSKNRARYNNLVKIR